MTHGNLEFYRQDGTLGANVYTYHDGFTEEAFQELIGLPELLVMRWRMFEATPDIFARGAAKLVPTWYGVELAMRTNFPLEEFFACTYPDIWSPQASNLANWFCGIHFDRWMIIPADEMSYPGADAKIHDCGEGIFEFRCDQSGEQEDANGEPITIPAVRQINWRELLINAVNKYRIDYDKHEKTRTEIFERAGKYPEISFEQPSQIIT